MRKFMISYSVIQRQPDGSTAPGFGNTFVSVPDNTRMTEDFIRWLELQAELQLKAESAVALNIVELEG